MDFTEASALAALLAAALGSIAVGRDIWSRLRRIRVGGVEISFTPTREADDRPSEPVAVEVRATLAQLSRLSASEYALDRETRDRVDATLDRLERRLSSYTKS